MVSNPVATYAPRQATALDSDILRRQGSTISDHHLHSWPHDHHEQQFLGSQIMMMTYVVYGMEGLTSVSVVSSLPFLNHRLAQ